MEAAIGREMDTGADWACDVVRYLRDTGAFGFNCGGAQVMLEVAIHIYPFTHSPHL